MNKVCKLSIKFRYLILGEILKLVATRCSQKGKVGGNHHLVGGKGRGPTSKEGE